MRQGSKRAAIALMAVTAALAGCADAARTMAEAAVDAAGCIDVSAIQNTGGSFQYAGAVACKTASETFEWTNPSPAANIQWGGAVAGGTLAVSLRDALDREVAAFTLGGDAGAGGVQARSDFGFPTAPPFLGAWTIDLRYEAFAGTMGLQLTSFSGPAEDLRPSPAAGLVEAQPRPSSS